MRESSQKELSSRKRKVVLCLRLRITHWRREDSRRAARLSPLMWVDSWGESLPDVGFYRHHHRSLQMSSMHEIYWSWGMRNTVVDSVVRIWLPAVFQSLAWWCKTYNWGDFFFLLVPLFFHFLLCVLFPFETVLFVERTEQKHFCRSLHMTRDPSCCTAFNFRWWSSSFCTKFNPLIPPTLCFMSLERK